MAKYVDITPDVSLLEKMGQSGHSVAEAVSELVDNAIDARQQDQVVVVDIRFEVREGWLQVSDNARGMTEGQLARALVLGRSEKNGSSIGRFGLGLKTACTSLGSRFSVTTNRASSRCSYVAEYDEASFVAGAEWKLPIRRVKQRQEQGTQIRVATSRLYSGLQTSLVKALGWTFRHFISDGIVKILVNDVGVEATMHAVATDSVVRLEGGVAGRNIRGWAGLLVASSQRGWYGFDLVRHRRVIKRHEKIGFLPHPATARVVGELHLDDFDTNNIKTDFIRETAEWVALEKWLSEQISPIVAQSRAMAHGVVLPRQARRAKAGAADKDDGEVTLVVGHIFLTHTFEVAPDNPYMTILRLDEGKSLKIRTNFRAYGPLGVEPEIAACLNLAEAVALQVATRQSFVETKNEVFRSLIAQRRLLTELRDQASAVKN